MTSTHVVSVVKRLTQAQKVGHGGTLDPLATGVLPIAMGEATKTVAYVMDERKAYEFTLRLGEARDTDDAAGAVTATSELRPTDEEIRAALAQFVGMIESRRNTRPSRCRASAPTTSRDAARAVELAPREICIDNWSSSAARTRPCAISHDLWQGAYVRAIAVIWAWRSAACPRVRLAADRGRRLQRRQCRFPRCVGEDRRGRHAAAGPGSDDDRAGRHPGTGHHGTAGARLRSGQSIRMTPALVGDEAGRGGDGPGDACSELIALARLEGMELSPVRVFHHGPMPTGNRE